jgi:predicted N-acetyltransferase YhbS
MNVAIRKERPGDEKSIYDVTSRAFSGSEMGHHGEAQLVDRLRASCPEIISLVAEIDGRLVGHSLFTPVVIERNERHWRGMGLGPISVLPEYQGRGVGSRLIVAGLELLRAADVPFVVVLGHLDYYPRFGFVPASKYGVTTTFGAEADRLFMIQMLSHTSPEPAPGIAKYRPEFSDVG